MNRDEIEKLLEKWQFRCDVAAVAERAGEAVDLARTALALMAQLEDANAAQALVVERAAKELEPAPNARDGLWVRRLRKAQSRIRALADPSGVEALAALREERDALETAREMLGGFWAKAIAERDDALTRLAAAEAAQAMVVERAAEHVAAIERLAVSASIASCTCNIKTPDITFHAANCRYVKLQYIIAQCEDFRDLAPDDGVAALAALRAERDEAKRLMQVRHREMLAADDLMRKHQRRAERAEAERDDALARLAAAKAQVGALREALDKARDPGRDPDYCYDEEWEYTMRWDEAHDLLDGHDLSKPVEFYTLFKGPRKWAVNVPNSWDEEGIPDGWDAEIFDSEAEARAALASAQGGANG